MKQTMIIALLVVLAVAGIAAAMRFNIGVSMVHRINIGASQGGIPAPKRGQVIMVNE